MGRAFAFTPKLSCRSFGDTIQEVLKLFEWFLVRNRGVGFLQSSL